MTPDDLVPQIRDALYHYHDFSELVQHDLSRSLGAASIGDAPTQVQELRRVLASAIQQLRPRPDTPSTDPAWRPYVVVHQRFIMGRDLAEIEADLHIGRRQVLREQRRALKAMARSLLPPSTSALVSDSVLDQEISRLASDRRGTDVSLLLQSALEPVRALAQDYHTRLELAQPLRTTYLVCNPEVMRQLLLASLSFAIRCAAGGEVHVRLEHASTRPTLHISAVSPIHTSSPPSAVTVPETLLALAEAQQADIALEETANGLSLQIRLASARREVVVALVEDNPDAVRLFSRYVTGKGFRLVGLEQSVTAVEEITRLMPDVVVLDLMMSAVDGWEILQRLKADQRLRHIPVVICSVLDEPELAQSLGAAAYLRKPVRPVTLIDCLTQVLSR